jgi:hypothetical protein
MAQVPLQSNARVFLDDLRTRSAEDAYAYLTSIPSTIDTDPFFEEEWLDFKGRPHNDDDAKAIWSKALSGFGNITDGLIIWGIDARKSSPRNIDAASGLRLITDPYAFVSKLRIWARTATNPPVTGVEYEAYADPDTGMGFVICFVPLSGYRPHRAEFADKHYYYRAGDSFFMAEPGLLRTLFYPQLNPYMRVAVQLSYELQPSDLARLFKTDKSDYIVNRLLNGTSLMKVRVHLYNTGTATAKDMYVVLESSHRLDISQGPDWTKETTPEGNPAFRAQRSFHPGVSTRLFSSVFQENLLTSSLDSNAYELVPFFDRVAFTFYIYAEGARRQEMSVEFSRGDFDLESCAAAKDAGQA